MRTCPKCGFKDPAMSRKPDRRKRKRAAYMAEYRRVRAELAALGITRTPLSTDRTKTGRTRDEQTATNCDNAPG